MAAVNLTDLVAGVDFGSVVVSLLAVGVTVVGVLVLVSAAFKVLDFVGGFDRSFVKYAGQYWERDVYEEALGEVKKKVRSGGVVDGSSRAALADYEGLGKGSSSGGSCVKARRV